MIRNLKVENNHGKGDKVIMTKCKSGINNYFLVFLLFWFLIIFATSSEIIYADTLYVATSGNNISGNGSELNPWKTISYALSQTTGSQTDPPIIYVKSGVYSPSKTGETFPIVLDMKSNIFLVGEDVNNTILDAEYTGSCFQCFNIQNFRLENFTMTKGKRNAITCLVTSNFIVQNNIIENIDGSVAQGNDGAIEAADGAEVLISNNIIRNNKSSGIILGPSYSAIPILENNIIQSNEGQGLFVTFSEPILKNNIISYNEGQGIYVMQGNPLIGSTLENANDIYGNSLYNLDGSFNDTINATLNYWGSIDYDMINLSINIDKVKYIPYTNSTHDSIFQVTSLPEDVQGIPSIYKLQQNYPNPFNSVTKICFSLGNLAITRIILYNSLGEKLSEILNKELGAGPHEIHFNAVHLASGVYFYRLESGSYSQTRKMLIIK